MSHAECWDLLAVYRDLSAAEQALVDAHLIECPECAARLLACRRMDRDLAALADPRPPERLDARFAAAVAARRRPWAALVHSAGRVGDALAWAAVAVIAALLVAGLVLAGQPLVEQTRPAARPTATPAPGLGRTIVRDELIATSPYQPPAEGARPDLAPQLSPDGRRVAYFVPDNRPGGVNLLVVRDLATGKDIWWGLSDAGANAGLHSSARWSPDSRSLAFVLSRPREGGGVSSNLFRLDLERRRNWLQTLWAGILRLFGWRVAEGPTLSRLYGEDVTSSMGPAISVERWSADGRYVELAANPAGAGSPLRVRADGRGTRIIAEPLAAELGIEMQALRSQPVRAPTGDYWLGVVRTASLAERPAGAPAGGDSLLRYDVKSGQTQVLASCSGELRPLDLPISPDGEWIVFQAEGGAVAPAQGSLGERVAPDSERAVLPVEEAGAWAVRRDGTGLRQAPGLAGGEFVWGAPGRIYFRVPPREAGSGALYELDLASGRVGLVAGDWPEQNLLAASRDGSRLLVSRTLAQETELRWLELAPRPQSEPTPPEPTPTPRPTATAAPTAAPTITPVATGASIRVGGWSPDGRWLAFWQVEDSAAAAYGSPPATLHFYDAHTGETCNCPELGATSAYTLPLAWTDYGWVIVWDKEARSGVPCGGRYEVTDMGEPPAGEDEALSPGGRFRATTVEEPTEDGRLSVKTTFADVATSQAVQAVEYVHRGGLGSLGLGGEWVTDGLFLIRETLDRGPLLVDLENGRIIAVMPELFGLQQAPSPEVGFWAAAVAGADAYHIVLGGVGVEAAFPALRLYHSETGQIEELEFAHAWNPLVSPDGRWLLMDARPERGGYESYALWARPVDPPGSPAQFVAEGDYLARWSPDGSQVAMARPGRNSVSVYSFPEGRLLGSWATGGYRAQPSLWSPDGSRLALSGNMPGKEQYALFVVEP